MQGMDKEERAWLTWTASSGPSVGAAAAGRSQVRLAQEGGPALAGRGALRGLDDSLAHAQGLHLCMRGSLMGFTCV